MSDRPAESEYDLKKCLGATKNDDLTLNLPARTQTLSDSQISISATMAFHIFLRNSSTKCP